MVKPRDEVIAQFDAQVNMSADELEAWLAGPQSATAGTGVGLESGRRIVAILRKNPGREPDKYEEEDIEHMRKVVGYNARHMAQEDHLKETKTEEELADTKSTISLKNWGHDPLKTLGATKASQDKPDADGDDTETQAELEEASGKDAVDAASQKDAGKNSAPKRKLADDAEGEAGAGNEKAPADEDDAESEVSLGEDDAAERPRKKSKTTQPEEQPDEGAA